MRLGVGVVLVCELNPIGEGRSLSAARVRQTVKRTGTFYARKAEAGWDPKREQTRFGRRGLVEYDDPKTGEVG